MPSYEASRSISEISRPKLDPVVATGGVASFTRTALVAIPAENAATAAPNRIVLNILVLLRGSEKTSRVTERRSTAEQRRRRTTSVPLPRAASRRNASAQSAGEHPASGIDRSTPHRSSAHARRRSPAVGLRLRPGPLERARQVDT